MITLAQTKPFQTHIPVNVNIYIETFRKIDTTMDIINDAKIRKSFLFIVSVFSSRQRFAGAMEMGSIHPSVQVHLNRIT